MLLRISTDLRLSQMWRTCLSEINIFSDHVYEIGWHPNEYVTS